MLATLRGRSWQRDVLVGGLAVALGAGLVAAVWVLGGPLALLLAAIIIAQALAPVVGWVERRLPRAPAVVLVYLLLLALLGGVGAAIVWPVVDDAMRLLADAPALTERLQARLAALDPTPDDRLVGLARDWLPSALPPLVAVPLAAAEGLAQSGLVLLLAAYWAIAGRRISRAVLGRLPPRYRSYWARALADVGDVMGGYVRALLVDIAIVGVVLAAGFALIGLDWPVLVGLLAALLKAFPLVGRFLGAGPVLVVGLFDDTQQLLAALALYGVLQLVDVQLLKPKLIAAHVDISPLLVLFALIAGGAAGGVLGALAAVPLAGALQVLILRGAALADDTVQDARRQRDRG